MLPLAGENTASTRVDPTGEAAATSCLVAAGVAPQRAALQVQEVTGRVRAAGDG